jgi:hypothetical protein
LYNDWDYGPKGVYGNLPLPKGSERKYYKIEKTGPKTATIRHFNPSGVVINITSVTFEGGIKRVEETNQWGETYEYRKYTQKDSNEFIMTDLYQGVNNFLPCKYAKYIYKDDLLTEVQYYSFSGQLTENRNGVAIIRYKRYNDKIRFAEIREMSFYDAQSRPVKSKATDYHTVVNIYDNHDNKISESYLGIHDEPIRIRNSNLAEIRYFYDKNNNQIKVEFHGLDGRVTKNIAGIAIVESEYSHGYEVKSIRFDSLHVITRASASGDSIAIIKTEYDNKGNEMKSAYFDEREAPISDHSGIHAIVNAYSPANMLLQTLFLDDFDNPSVDRDDVHRTTYIRDGLGRIVQQSTYGIKDEPLKNYSAEVYMLKYRYDEYGRRVSVSYWLDSATRMPHWDGSYEGITKYNDDGQPTEYGCLDQHGNPFRTEDGSSMAKLVYKADGRLGERQFLYNDSLIVRTAGVTKDYSIIRYEHDENGRVNELTFLNKDYKPVNATMWFGDSFPAHRIVFIYKGNRVVEQRFYEAGSDSPARIIDCLKSDFIAPSGIKTGRKNAY